jgi:hypothetical protein
MSSVIVTTLLHVFLGWFPLYLECKIIDLMVNMTIIVGLIGVSFYMYGP